MLSYDGSLWRYLCSLSIPFGGSKFLAFNDQFSWLDWYNATTKVTFYNSLLRRSPAFPEIQWSCRAYIKCDSSWSYVFATLLTWWRTQRHPWQWHDWQLLLVCFSNPDYGICLQPSAHQSDARSSDCSLDSFTRAPFPFHRERLMALEESGDHLAPCLHSINEERDPEGTGGFSNATKPARKKGGNGTQAPHCPIATTPYYRHAPKL